MSPRTATPITLPLTLLVTCAGETIGHYQPLSIATAGSPTATPHLNIDTGTPAMGAQVLDELAAAARAAGWDVHDYTRPTPGRTARLEHALRARKSTLRATGHTSWHRWTNYHPSRPIPRAAAPILVAFTHSDGDLDPLLTSLLVNGRIYGVHAVHLGPLDALPGAGRAMIDLSVTTNHTGRLALTQPTRTIPL